MNRIIKIALVLLLFNNILSINRICAQALMFNDNGKLFSINPSFWNQVEELNTYVTDPLPLGEPTSIVVMSYSHGRVVLDVLRNLTEIDNKEVVGYATFQSTPILVCNDFSQEKSIKLTPPFLAVNNGYQIQCDSVLQRDSYPRMVIAEDSTGLYVYYYSSKKYEPFIDKEESNDLKRMDLVGNRLFVEYDTYHFRDAQIEERIEQLHQRTLLRHEELYTCSLISYDIGIFYGNNGEVFLRYDLCLLTPQLYDINQSQRYIGVVKQGDIQYRLYGPAVNEVFERVGEKTQLEFKYLEEGEIEDFYEMSYIIQLKDGHPMIYGFGI